VFTVTDSNRDPAMKAGAKKEAVFEMRLIEMNLYNRHPERLFSGEEFRKLLKGP